MARELPKRCRYGRYTYAVLDYEAPDRFLIEREGEPGFWVRRDRIEFLPVLAVEAVNEVVGDLRAQALAVAARSVDGEVAFEDDQGVHQGVGDVDGEVRDLFGGKGLGGGFTESAESVGEQGAGGGEVVEVGHDGTVSVAGSAVKS